MTCLRLLYCVLCLDFQTILSRPYSAVSTVLSFITLFVFQGAEESELIFYQWVVFMLVINAILFKIPHLIWKSYEGGIMNAFFSGKGLKSKLLTEDETNQNIDFDMFYYKKLKGQNNTYYFIFQLCQLFNIGMLILNWWATDAFLGGNFHSYGTDVIDYYTHVESFACVFMELWVSPLYAYTQRDSIPHPHGRT